MGLNASHARLCQTTGSYARAMESVRDQEHAKAMANVPVMLHILVKHAMSVHKDISHHIKV